MARTLVLIYFGKPELEHTIKSDFTAFQTADPDMLIFQNILFIKRVWD